MEQAGDLGAQAGDLGLVGRQRVEAMVETLASLGSRGESLAEVAHDARNMVTALGLYCDLLEEPGVLAVPFAHYGHELRLVAAASRRLVEKLVALHAQAGAGAELHSVSIPGTAGPGAGSVGAGSVGAASVGVVAWPSPAGAASAPESAADARAARTLHSGRDGAEQHGLEHNGSRQKGIASAQAEPRWNLDGNLDRNHRPNAGPNLDAAPAPGGERLFPVRGTARRWETLLSAPVDNLAAEMLANRNLLSALAGPGIAVTVDAEGGARPVRLMAEDLTRLLVNLVKNAAEAIPTAAGPGRIQISLREDGQKNAAPASLLLAIEDNGPGIPAAALGRVFDPGFTTHARNAAASSGWPILHRGLGLAIARSLVEAAGGRITASNREQGGARIALELPVRAA